MYGYRKLHAGDAQRFAEHVIRLDEDDRRARFGGTVSDDEVRRYCIALDWQFTTVIAFFDQGEIRAAAELRMERRPAQSWAEAAFSVEKAFQGSGIGRELMRRIVVVARNSGLSRLAVICRPENWRMRHLLAKFGAESAVDLEEVSASIRLRGANPVSLVQETLDDSVGLLPIIFDQWYANLFALLTPTAETERRAA